MGWLTAEWSNRKEHQIGGSVAGAQTGYQVKIVAHKGAGADSGQDVYLGANVRDDFGDIRFTDEDGETLLDYWMESYTSGVQAVFWVEVPNIPASPGSATIYIYYGNPGATTTSDGAATFPDLFTHFPGTDLPAGWQDWYTQYGSRTVTASQLRLVGATGSSAVWQNRAVRTTGVFGLNRRLMFKVDALVHSNRHCADFGESDQPDEKGPTNRVVWVCSWDHTWHGFISRAAGAETGSAYTVVAGDIVWIARQSGLARYWTNQTLRASHTTNVPTVDLPVYFDVRRGGVVAPTAELIYIDWVAIAKWVDPEPSHGAWGSEESAPGPPGVQPAKIELRLTDVDPPAPDPRRTIYRDLLNLPDPVLLGITIRYFNYDDVGLYFRVTGSGPGYTFGTVDLGLLASGANAYRNLDNFASRAKPGAELTENIKLILRAYTDAGYTNLRWTYEKTVTVIFIDSSDPSYIVDALNNFDDGTVQGWAVFCELNCRAGFPTLAPATDYVLSPAYSLKMTNSSGTGVESRVRVYKSFTTPDRPVIYAIFDVRLAIFAAGYAYLKYLTFQRDGTLLVYLGRPSDAVTSHYIPLNKWMRIVVPLPRNTTLELRVVLDAYGGPYVYPEYYLWMDDFKIISK